MTKLRDLTFWDNGGESFDRYTALWPDGSYLGMSENPFHPQGFCQHGEGCVDLQPRWNLIHGLFTSQLGQEIQFEALPPDCQKAVLHDLEEKYD